MRHAPRPARPASALVARTAAAAAAGLGLLLAGCAGTPPAPLPTVERVDLGRYAGTWYEIARLPNRFQSMCVADTRARYRLEGERVEVVNSCTKADGGETSIRGHAEAVAGSGNARLAVTFFWPFKGDYWVLALDPGYTQVLVGAPDRQYAWVLARSPRLDEAALQALLDRAQALGFDRSAFVRTAQREATAPGAR